MSVSISLDRFEMLDDRNQALENDQVLRLGKYLNLHH
jgi:hypothetical protein